MGFGFFFVFPQLFFRYYFKIPAEFSETLKIEMPITSTVISFYIYIHPLSMISLFHACNTIEEMRDVNVHFSGHI